MVPLLLGATVVFYALGIATSSRSRAADAAFKGSELPFKSADARSKALMVVGVVLGAGLLLYFKYMNFFIEQFAALFGMMGMHTNWSTFNIIVPIGISL